MTVNEIVDQLDVLYDELDDLSEEMNHPAYKHVFTRVEQAKEHLDQAINLIRNIV